MYDVNCHYAANPRLADTQLQRTGQPDNTDSSQIQSENEL